MWIKCVNRTYDPLLKNSKKIRIPLNWEQIKIKLVPINKKQENIL